MANLYSREQFEAELAELNKLRSQSTQALLEKRISGFTFNEFRDKCDELERQMNNKLAGTRLALADAAATKAATPCRRHGVRGCTCWRSKSKLSLATLKARK